MSTNDPLILQALQKASSECGIAMKEKLRKLLIDRQVKYIPANVTLERLRLLGTGVFGQVDLIRYEKKLYAHKKALLGKREQKMSILEEGIKLTDIAATHRNVQRLFYINLQTFGLVIDYCSNGSLHSYVEKANTQYTLLDVLNWGYQLADALSFLHANKIIHRDVKMQNILLKDNYQTLVLTDYGTATQMGKSWMTENVGTPITMAPEVFAGEIYAEQCDIYSWAIVFWQLITKQLLPYGGKGKGFLLAVVQDKRRPPRLNHCPEILIALLYRSWHSNPNDRTTLSFIKKVLQILIRALPKKKQEYTAEMAEQLQQQWLSEYNLPDRYLPNEPRPNNELSMNIYQEHLSAMDRIMRIEKEVNELKQKKEKYEQYERLLDENQELQEQIDRIRGQTLC